MKTNLVHDLYQVRKYGMMTVEQLKGIISPAEYERAKAYVPQSWFTLPADTLTTLIFRVSQSIQLFPLYPSSQFICI